MNSEQRREQVLHLLKEKSQPLSASAIAKEFGVSRQIIVGDVALLRASGHDIAATPRGYILQKSQNRRMCRTIACRHRDEQMARELYTVVDNGCAVLDVTVEHPVYGQISGQLQIFSRFDADQFIQKLGSSNAPPLCALTNGIHLHTIAFEHEEDFNRVLNCLKQQGILFSESENLPNKTF